jgi:hypothetical protein
MSKNIVTVIVPTLAEKNRELQLKRCITSIRNSSKINILIITVINGNRFDQELCRWLQKQPDILFDYQSTPSSPLAQLRGRQLVKTPYFAFIDDDDEFLPGAIDARMAKMEANPKIDIVVTNGFRHGSGKEDIAYIDMENISNDPLAALFNYAWLHNCNNLFRTDTIPDTFFSDTHPYAEWTWLAFKLAMQRKNVDILNDPTFRYYDTPNSLSKSDAYTETFLGLYRKMLSLSPPANITRLIRKRISADWHSRSNHALQKGLLLKAFICHWHSLFELGGLQYLSYSRHLLVGLIKNTYSRIVAP